MRLLVMLLVVASVSGCGGAVILESRTDRLPETVPAREVGRDAAIAAAVEQASHQHVTHTSVHRVDRHKDYWSIELFGVVRGEHDARDARVRARVSRWSGEILAYDCQTLRSRAHDRSHDRDRDDDHGHDHDHDD